MLAGESDSKSGTRSSQTTSGSLEESWRWRLMSLEILPGNKQFPCDPLFPPSKLISLGLHHRITKAGPAWAGRRRCNDEGFWRFMILPG